MSIALPQVTVSEVRESVAVARSHGEKFFEQIVWQVENGAWSVLGYGSWDAMREGEYGDLGVVAPRADRPELVARLRRNGLTQQQIASTIGVHESTVSRHLANASSDEAAPDTITNSRGQERPASYTRTVPQSAAETDQAPEAWSDGGQVTGDVEPPAPSPVTINPVLFRFGTFGNAVDKGGFPPPTMASAAA